MTHILQKFLQSAKRATPLFFIWITLLSCSQQETPKPPENIAPKAPDVKEDLPPNNVLKPPQATVIADKPKPLVVEVPVKPGGSYVLKEHGKDKKVELLPPETKPAGLFYIMQTYTTDNGLALDAINCGLIDKIGNLWFGTEGGGVSKFDGKSFVNFTTAQGLGNNGVLCILEDTSGNLWFGTGGGGLSRYDGNSFTTYTKEEGLANNYILCSHEDTKGNFWFGTLEGGLSKYDGHSFTTYTIKEGLPDNTVWCILEDKTGTLWFGTNEGVSKYDGQSFTTITTKEGLANNKIRSSLQDNEGNLWFGTEDGGASLFDGSSFTTFTTKEGLANNTVRALLQDKRGKIWFGTNGGASEYNGKAFTNYTTLQGLSDDNVRTILEDKSGNIWFGTFGGGVMRYDGKFLTIFTPAQGLAPNLVRSILEDNAGNLWFSTQGGGVSHYDGKSFVTYSEAQGLANDVTRSSFKDKSGNFWFGTEGGGVSKYDGKSFTTYNTLQGLANDDVRSILEDKEGNIWFGTYGGGASKYDGNSFTTYSTLQGLVNDYILTILKDKSGNLWFGTDGGGVSRYDGKTFTNFSTEEGLAGNAVFSILEDNKGNLWFGTDGGGVSRYDGKNFLTYTTEQGLPNNVVYQVITTKEQDIALGTNQGLAILTEFTSKDKQSQIPAQNNLSNAELKHARPIFEIYNSKRGYPLKDANAGQNSMYLDSKGIIWIGTGADKTALVRLDYAKLNKNNAPPSIFIQKVKLNNENIVWNILKEKKEEGPSPDGQTITSPALIEEVLTFGRPLSETEKKTLQNKFKNVRFGSIEKFNPVPENLVLPHEHNNITFDFVAVEPAQPQNVLYQYMLEGYDKDWSPPSNTTTANFGNIFEGTYQFKLKAQSPFGVWSEPLTYTFRVLPPWFRTWWAYALYALSGISSIYSYIRWRTAKLQAQFEHAEYLYHMAERFVPKRVLQLLNKEHLEDVQLGDSAKVRISALFADIRGFTTLAESLSPEQTALFLNTYMSYMAPLIREKHGFVNQFLGDGILAYFPETPSDSVDAALAMIRALPLFNREVEARGFAHMSVGIGINTGDAILLALGEKERLEANMVSDAINTASRVEGLNKFYKTQLLISESVYQELAYPDHYLIRRVDKVRMKGKTVGLSIYEVKELPGGALLQSENLYYALYTEAFTAYEKGDFVLAEALFKSCLEKKPDDIIAKLHLDRCRNFQQAGTPEGWDGTVTLSEK